MKKKSDLENVEHCMDVGARWAGQSISEAADQLGVSWTAISRV